MQLARPAGIVRSASFGNCVVGQRLGNSAGIVGGGMYAGDQSLSRVGNHKFTGFTFVVQFPVSHDGIGSSLIQPFKTPSTAQRAFDL